MRRGRLVAWADVPPGSVVWDASPDAGGDHYASVAVRWPAPDERGYDGAWIAVHGGATPSSRGGWTGAQEWHAPTHDRPAAPEWPWDGDCYVLARDDGRVEVLAGGVTDEDIQQLARMEPAQVLAWCERRSGA